MSFGDVIFRKSSSMSMARLTKVPGLFTAYMEHKVVVLAFRFDESKSCVRGTYQVPPSREVLGFSCTLTKQNKLQDVRLLGPQDRVA